MADTQHTPLPWTIDHERIGPPGEPVALLCDVNPSVRSEIQRAHGYDTGGVIDWPRMAGDTVDDTENEANADFILRACNSHYDLLDALETLLNILPDSNMGEKAMGEIGVTANTMHDIISTAEDAIAKAKGGDTANIRI